MRSENLGAWIDEHDIVVRFNKAELKGYENDVGSKTSILVTNPYPEPGRSVLSGEGAVVIVLSPQTRRPFADHLESWVAGRQVLFSYTPDILPEIADAHAFGLSTGSYGIHLLGRILCPTRASVTGFTMFMHGTRHHYFSDIEPSGVKAHNFEEEARIFIRLIGRLKCPVTITEEIAWVAQKTGEALAGNIQVMRLSNKKWHSC